MWNIRLMAVIGMLTITSLAGTAWHAYSKGRDAGQCMMKGKK